MKTNPLKKLMVLIVAGAMLPAPQIALAGSTPSPVQVQSGIVLEGATQAHRLRRHRPHRHYHHRRYHRHPGYRYHRHPHYRHHRYRRRHNPWPYIVGGIIIGGIIYQSATWDRHVRWCYNRYRSYNHRSNTYQPYHGSRRRCRSPYIR